MIKYRNIFRCIKCAILIFFCCFWTNHSLARDMKKGVLVGSVIDDSTHLPIESAQIIITGHQVGTTSDNNGRCYLTLSPGKYRVKVQRVGYKTLAREVDVFAGDSSIYKFSLSPKIYSGSPVFVEGESAGDGIFALTLTPRAFKTTPALAERDVFRMMQGLPGVTGSSDYSSELYVRGGASDQTLVLFDDVPVYNPYHAGGFFSLFNADGVGKIAFQPGVVSAQYGGRLAGRLNISPRIGSRERIKLKVSLGLASSHLRVEGPLLKGVFIVAARRTYLDVITRMFSNEKAPYHFYDMQGGFSRKLSAKHQITLQSFYSKDALTDVLERDESGIKGLRQPAWGNRIFSLRWQYQPANNKTLETQLAYSNAYNESNTLHIDIDNQIRDRFIRQKFNLWSERHHLTAGWEIHRMSLSYDWKFMNARELGNLIRPPEEAFFDDAPPVFHQYTASWQGIAYLQNRYQLSNKFTVTAGLRADWQTFSSRWHGLPRLQLAYQRGKNLRFTAAYAHGVQHLYTLKEIKKDDILRPFSIYFPVEKDAPSLSSRYVTLGMAANIKERLKVHGEVYYKQLRHIPGFNFISQNRVLRDGRLSGLDLQFQQLFPGNAFLTLNYSLSFTRLSENSEHFYASFDRRHSLKMLSAIPLSKDWQFSAFWTYQSGLPFTPVIGKFLGSGSENDQNSGLFLDPLNWQGLYSAGWGDVYGAKNSRRYPAYHRLDVAFSKTWKTNPTEWELRLQVLNVYNRKNPLFSGLDLTYQQPRQEKTNNLPIIPTIGLTAKF